MRLAVTSVVATSDGIDELCDLGAVQVVDKLAATTVRREANLPTGMSDLAQKGLRTQKRLHTLQVAALKAIALSGYDLLTPVSRKPRRDPSQHIVAVHAGKALQHGLGNRKTMLFQRFLPAEQGQRHRINESPFHVEDDSGNVWPEKPKTLTTADLLSHGRLYQSNFGGSAVERTRELSARLR